MPLIEADKTAADGAVSTRGTLLAAAQQLTRLPVGEAVKVARAMAATVVMQDVINRITTRFLQPTGYFCELLPVTAKALRSRGQVD